MPCRDYESDTWGNSQDYYAETKKLKQQLDRLARIACKAMETLEENEIEDLLLLKDDEIREWWKAHKEADAKERARLAEIERKARVKAEALAKLSTEERQLLGIEVETKFRRPRKKAIVEDEFDEDEWIRVTKDTYE